ncbi:AAA family ATPase [Thermococcus barophilus]|nr:ATP-binding protein [Thermococcus barophilus]
MLFDPKPKVKREDIFDREEELKKVMDSIKNCPITLILGIRRVGKSSVLRVALNESDAIGIYIDARKLYMNVSGWITKDELKRELEIALLNLKPKILKSLQSYFNLAKFSIKGFELSFREKNLADILENLNEFGEDRNKLIVLAFDEAQYLRFYGTKGGREFLALVAYAYDNLPNIHFVLTGSEIGLLHDFLGFENYEALLFGRIYNEITIEPFTREKSIEFLKKGFDEANLKVSEWELEKAVDVLDGIPGWLVEYGFHYLHSNDPQKALEYTMKKARQSILEELKELERRSKRYTLILKAVALGFDRWEKIKEYLETHGGRITNARFSSLLKNLERMSWIKSELKDGKKVYSMTDPVIERVLREL